MATGSDAGTHTKAVDVRDFLTPDPALAVGTTHAGFTVIDVLSVPEISATAYVLRHDASGARAMWLACADTNRSFAIAFKTPPADDTGVFHILEHSVLCGSDRFPVKEPFVNLLKTSMQTFLNAMTFPDKTVYPVASTNVQDLENLMDVYLDAVLHPAIYQRPRIFEQEGWHLELVDADGNPAEAGTEGAHLIYNGVVFNEMKGALSDPDDVLFQEVNRALYPDTPYAYESGGNPRAIPTLTYEKFLDTHARHYDLANSYTILYGDLDIDRELGFVDERFRAAGRRGAGDPNPMPDQKPVVAPLTQVEMATAPNNREVALAYVVGDSSQRNRMLAADVLVDALAGSNEAPLKRAVLDANLGDDLQVMLIDGVRQPMLLLILKGAHEGVAEQFRALVEETCAQLVAEGIEHRRLEAALAQCEFNLREGDWGYHADGVAISITSLASWLYDDDDPVAYLRYEDALAELKQMLATGGFEQLLAELVVHSTHSAEVELVPVEEGSEAEEAAELAGIQERMVDAELTQVTAEVEALRVEQETPDAPEDLAKLPRLSIADIGDAPAVPATPLDSSTPLPSFGHDLDTHGIDYVWHYFDLRRLAVDELPYVGLISDLLGKLDTASHTASELDMEIELNLGDLAFFVEAHAHDDDPSYARPMFSVGASALSTKTDALVTLPAEVWGTTSFADTDRMRDILTQRRIGLEQRFLGAGHTAALARLTTHFSASADALGRMEGVEYYLFLRDLLAHWDERAAELPAKLTELSRRIFTADEVIVSFVGPAQDQARFWELGGTLGLPTLGADACVHRLALPTPSEGPLFEAFTLPADVCYVAESQPRPATPGAPQGTWLVASRALSYDYLWNEVRVKGGAYGTGFRHTTSGLAQFWSYRDPGIDNTLARFEHAGEWLADWNGTEEELEGYIVSTVAAHDTPLKPRQLARRQDAEYFTDRPAGWRESLRSQQLTTTPADLRNLASTIQGIADRRSVVVFGSPDKIAASSLGFTVTSLMEE